MTTNFPVNNGMGDTLAFRAATEAGIGLTLRGEKPNAENVKA